MFDVAVLLDNSVRVLKDRAERNFQVAAEACIDLANHLVAARGLRTPEGYGDSFVVLAEEGIMPAEFAEHIGRLLDDQKGE